MFIISQNATGKSVNHQDVSLDLKALQLHGRFLFSNFKERLLMLKSALDTKAQLGKIIAHSLAQSFQKNKHGDTKAIVLSYVKQYEKEQQDTLARCNNDLWDFTQVLSKDDTLINNASSRLTAAINNQALLVAKRYDIVLQLMRNFEHKQGTEQDFMDLISKLNNVDLRGESINTTARKPEALKAKL